MEFDINLLLKELAEELGEDVDADTLIEEAKSFFENKSYWQEKENEAFQFLECFTVTEHGFPCLFVVGELSTLQQWGRLDNYKTEALRNFSSDAKTFLDDKPKDLLGVTEGFWLCNCETGFVRSSYITFCEKCKCCIAKTKREFQIIG